MADKKQNEIELLKTLQRYETIRAVIQGVVWISLAYLGVQAISHLAGKSTAANFAFSYFTSADSNYGLPWVVAFISVIYGLAERRLRMRKTKYFSNRITKLEKQFDVNRTSSELLTDGQTNPKDEWL